jgi:hypothetical protein
MKFSAIVDVEFMEPVAEGVQALSPDFRYLKYTVAVE